MKIEVCLFQLLACMHVSRAFSPLLQRSTLPRSTTTIFSQWEDEEEDVAVKKVASFEEAGETLKKEEDKSKMDDMDDYDRNPQYNPKDVDRVREAIKQRTEALGIEKSKVSQEANQEAAERAQKMAQERQMGGSMEQMLDLSQISDDTARGQDDSTPAMFYEPENEMTEEEMREADPDGYLPIPEQVMKELSSATWPTFVAATKEIFVLVAIGVLSAVIIIYWDSFLRDFYMNLGFIPRPEDVMSGSENMVLPEGWTNGMSDEDLLKFQNEVATSAGSVASSFNSAPIDTGFPEL